MSNHQRKPGKFWPRVRPLIWEKAQQLFQEEQAKPMHTDFKGITATHKELRECGYFQTAKLIVLCDPWLQKKGLPTLKEETITENLLLPFKNRKPQNSKCKGR
ncbi:MAG: hypothetical protein AOA65_2140 [Candidatus Bathyarchaeota archaeon BA1]|nr:MAG: hypothetical protein AOA65_2140 [Candidatus Bathyarchaeota archaeon BA1]